MPLHGVVSFTPAADSELIATCRCPLCGTKSSVRITNDELAQYEGGALLHDAFSRLSDTDRETLLTGICYDCQNSVFSEEEPERWDGLG